MNRKKEIQPWRYAAVSLAFFCLLLPKIQLFSGADGAVGILLATALLCIFHRIIQNIRQRKKKSGSKAVKKAAALVRSLWCTAILCLLTGLGAFLLRDCFWPEMSVWMAWVLFLIMLLPALGKQHCVWQRITAVSFSWLLFFIAVMPLLAVRQIQTVYLYASVNVSLISVLEAAGIYLVFSWYLLLIPGTKSRGMWPDSKEALFLLNGLFLAVLCMIMGLVYGKAGASFRRWPILSLLQGISVPGKFLERVDAIWAAACLFSLFLAAGLLLETIFASPAVPGTDNITVSMWRYKDITAFALLAAVVILYRYSGVEAQDRAYVSTFMADREDDGYVFWFPQQEKNETVYRIRADSFKKALEIFTKNSRKQPDFGHIRATVLGDELFADEALTESLFDELAAWQDMDENSYVFGCADPGSLVTTDTEGTVSGIYLSELYENHFGQDVDHPVLRELLTAWENGDRRKDIPRVVLTDDTVTVTQPG